MTAYARSGRRSLLGSLVAVVASKARTQGRTSRLAVAAGRVRENLGTLAAMGAFDLGGFLTLHRGGWFVVGASLLLADWALQG